MDPKSYNKIHFEIDNESDGMRLDRFLGQNEVIASRTKAAQLIDDELVKVNGKPSKSSMKVSVGDSIEVLIPIEKKITGLVPSDIALDIVYEDRDILIINKPAGMVVHPSAGHSENTLVNALLNYTKDLSMGFNEERPGIVHRIDRDTSGLLVVAKNDTAHAKLAAQFKEKTARRNYLAITYGKWKSTRGTFESLLARHPVDRKRMASTKNADIGKRAVTHYEVIQVSQDFTLVRFRLDTGRTHQIRVHCSDAGHPIVGDNLYGANSRTTKLKDKKIKQIVESMNRFALHAYELSLTHPTSSKPLTFRAPWPQDLIALSAALDLEVQNAM